MIEEPDNFNYMKIKKRSTTNFPYICFTLVVKKVETLNQFTKCNICSFEPLLDDLKTGIYMFLHLSTWHLERAKTDPLGVRILGPGRLTMTSSGSCELARTKIRLKSVGPVKTGLILW